MKLSKWKNAENVGLTSLDFTTLHSSLCLVFQQLRHNQQQISVLQNEVDTLRSDNVKLYEKIKFLQSYPTKVTFYQLLQWNLQSRPKVVGTLELYHVSPIPPSQCWEISRFFQQKGKKSPDYQH